jgi:hypothetical protein
LPTLERPEQDADNQIEDDAEIEDTAPSDSASKTHRVPAKWKHAAAKKFQCSYKQVSAFSRQDPFNPANTVSGLVSIALL